MSSAEKLLARMKRTKAGWTHKDLDTLYRGFGFEVEEDGPHSMYIHSTYPQLRASVTRSHTVAIGYVQHALKLIEELKSLEGKAKRQ